MARLIAGLEHCHAALRTEFARGSYVFRVLAQPRSTVLSHHLLTVTGMDSGAKATC